MADSFLDRIISAGQNMLPFGELDTSQGAGGVLAQAPGALARGAINIAGRTSLGDVADVAG